MDSHAEAAGAGGDDARRTLPEPHVIAEAGAAFADAARALATAIVWARRIRDEGWPIADESVDGNCTEQIDNILAEDRAGSRWDVEDLKDLAADLQAGPDQAPWILDALNRGDTT
jgi:hypothetical protein